MLRCPRVRKVRKYAYVGRYGWFVQYVVHTETVVTVNNGEGMVTLL
jgi:hypothetical protein